MKTRIVEKVVKTLHNGSTYTIMVYGELTDVKEISGMFVTPVTFNGRNNKVCKVDFDKKQLLPGFNTMYCPTKQFNMGWSICVEPDEFDREVGLKICKRRFAKSPLTTQNGRFLTLDMCQAIVDNEAEYIVKNLPMFLPKVEDNSDKYKFCFNFDGCGVKKDESSIVLDTEILGDFIKNAMNELLGDSCCDDNKNECACGDECCCKYKPNKGDYVTFEHNGEFYTGIFNQESVNMNNPQHVEYNFFFLYSYGDNSSKLYRTIVNSKQIKFNKASEETVIRIDGILLEKFELTWDNSIGSFKLNF